VRDIDRYCVFSSLNIRLFHRKKPGGISHAERRLRVDVHKIHTVALLAGAGVRNRWLNDELLHVRSCLIVLHCLCDLDCT
jgi:hypothetical protein